MTTKSRELLYGSSVRAAAERATKARKEADKLACEAWIKRMLGFGGLAQPSPALDALNAGFGFLVGENASGRIEHLEQLVDGERFFIPEADMPRHLKVLVAAKLADERWRYGHE